MLRSQRHAGTTFSSHELPPRDVSLAILIMLLKPALGTARPAKDGDSADTEDHLTLTSPFQVREEGLARCHRAVGSATRKFSELASTALPLFLAAVTEPVMLLLLTNPGCPINLLGAVNVRNRFEVLWLDLCDLQAIMGSHNSRFVARMLGQSQVVKRGIKYDLEVAILMTAHVEEKETNPVPAYRPIFTMLELGKTDAVGKNTATRGASNDGTERTVTPESRLPMSLLSTDPLKWAALCKDYNHIHFPGLAAKLFGRPGKLAHGNYAAAIAIRKVLESHGLQRTGSIPSWMDVDFLRPTGVPSVLSIEARSATDDITVIVISNRGRKNVFVNCGVSKLWKLVHEAERLTAEQSHIALLRIFLQCLCNTNIKATHDVRNSIVRL
jgi:acyl dehydratase